MKILAITDSYPPHHSGGYELRSRDVLTGLTMRGHDVRVITTRCPSPNCTLHLDEKNIFRVLRKRSDTHSFILRISFDIFELRFLDRMLKSMKPDIIYLSHLGDLSKPIFFFFSNRNFPIVFDDGGAGIVYLSRVFKQGLYFYERETASFFQSKAKSLIVEGISLLSGNLIPKKLAWPKKMSVYFNNKRSLEIARQNNVPFLNEKILYSGVDLKIFPCKTQDEPHVPLRIVVPGRIEPNKGTRDVISLVEILEQMGIQTSVTVVGKVDHQSYYDDLLKYVEQLNLKSDVRFQSMLDHERLASIYRESDICFFPSYQKPGMSRVPLEAMASGCLVISYGNEASNEVIVNSKTGYLVDEGDVQAVAAIVKDVVEDPTIYESVIGRARTYIETSCSLETYIDKIEKYMTSIIKEFV